MAKISTYKNYVTGKTTAEVDKFKETGVLPVSGKYTETGDMETKNVPMSELLGGGSGLPEIESGDAGKVLTVNANEDGTQWDTVDVLPEIDAERDFQKVLTVAQGGNLEWSAVDIPTYYTDYPITRTGYSFGLNYKNDQFKLGGTNNNELTLTNPVPAPGTNQHRGEFLTVNNSDEIVWDSPAIPEISQHNGDVSVVKATNDVSSGGYVFDVNLDSDTLEKRSTEGANPVSYIAVKNPVPPTTGANDGDVLTVDANGDYDWAPAQGGGGGSSVPEYTADDENKVLGVFVDRVWDRQSSKYVITDTRLGWRDGIPEFPNLGSGGEWGVEPVVKLSYKYNDEIGEYEMSSEAGFAGCPYNTFGENEDAQYGTWRFKEWKDYGDYPYSVVNNTYVAEIDNNWFINFGYLRDGYDPEYSEPSEHPDANSILFKVKHHGAIVPFVCIEFINESGKSLTVSVESEETGGGFGETMVPITDNGVSVNNVIPNNTFVQITVLGHGYTIKTQSTELPVH